MKTKRIKLLLLFLILNLGHMSLFLYARAETNRVIFDVGTDIERTYEGYAGHKNNYTIYATGKIMNQYSKSQNWIETSYDYMNGLDYEVYVYDVNAISDAQIWLASSINAQLEYNDPYSGYNFYSENTYRYGFLSGYFTSYKDTKLIHYWGETYCYYGYSNLKYTAEFDINYDGLSYLYIIITMVPYREISGTDCQYDFAYVLYTNGVIQNSRLVFYYDGGSSSNFEYHSDHFVYLGRKHIVDTQNIHLNARADTPITFRSKISPYRIHKFDYITSRYDTWFQQIRKIGFFHYYSQTSNYRLDYEYHGAGQNVINSYFPLISEIFGIQNELNPATYNENETKPYWNYLKLKINEGTSNEIIIGEPLEYENHTIDFWTFTYKKASSEWVYERFYYVNQTIDLSDQDWPGFNWLRDGIEGLVNYFMIFLQFIYYLLHTAFSLLSGSVLWFILNVIWNIVFYWAYVGILWLLWYPYAGFLYVWFFLKYWIYDNFSLLITKVWEFLVTFIEPVFNWIIEALLPTIGTIIINTLTLLETIALWILTFGQLDFLEIQQAFMEWNTLLYNTIIEFSQLFIDTFYDTLQYSLFYVMNLGLIYMKMLYVQSRGLKNRYESLQLSKEVYLIPIRLIEKGMDRVAQFWNDIPML